MQLEYSTHFSYITQLTTQFYNLDFWICVQVFLVSFPPFPPIPDLIPPLDLKRRGRLRFPTGRDLELSAESRAAGRCSCSDWVSNYLCVACLNVGRGTHRRSVFLLCHFNVAVEVFTLYLDSNGRAITWEDALSLYLKARWL